MDEPSEELLDFLCRKYPRSCRNDLRACYEHATHALQNWPGAKGIEFKHPHMKAARKLYVHAMHGNPRNRPALLLAMWHLVSLEFEPLEQL